MDTYGNHETDYTTRLIIRSGDNLNNLSTATSSRNVSTMPKKARKADRPSPLAEDAEHPLPPTLKTETRRYRRLRYIQYIHPQL
jgi:hypothetical protein